MSSHPQKIGIYQVLETISSGLHTVYKVQGSGGKPLALKTAVKATLSSDEIGRFMREAEVCLELDHRNLVQVFDSGEVDGILYQAMDLLEGADLAVVLSSGRVFTWLQKTSMMQQICEGMEYAHRRGVVHRNLLPSNLFLEDSGRIRVLGFGMVRDESSTGNSLGITAAFQTYASPELIRGEICTPASDVFSMGVIFYELCSGRHPFIQGTTQGTRALGQVLDNIVRQTPPALTDIVADAPQDLDRVLQQALKKDPALRPANAGALRTLMAQASASKTAEHKE
jgi:serine/threonine protein kinase